MLSIFAAGSGVYSWASISRCTPSSRAWVIPSSLSCSLSCGMTQPKACVQWRTCLARPADGFPRQPARRATATLTDGVSALLEHVGFLSNVVGFATASLCESPVSVHSAAAQAFLLAIADAHPCSGLVAAMHPSGSDTLPGLQAPCSSLITSETQLPAYSPAAACASLTALTLLKAAATSPAIATSLG